MVVMVDPDAGAGARSYFGTHIVVDISVAAVVVLHSSVASMHLQLVRNAWLWRRSLIPILSPCCAADIPLILLETSSQLWDLSSSPKTGTLLELHSHGGGASVPVDSDATIDAGVSWSDGGIIDTNACQLQHACCRWDTIHWARASATHRIHALVLGLRVRCTRYTVRIQWRRLPASAQARAHLSNARGRAESVAGGEILENGDAAACVPRLSTKSLRDTRS
jgi:hypothetical protein